MESVNVCERQSNPCASPLPGDGIGAARAARPHLWPEMIGVAIGCAIVWFSKLAFPAVLFGCVIVAVMGAR